MRARDQVATVFLASSILFSLSCRTVGPEPSSAHPDAARDVRTSTYSIVARDPDTGELGVAVQSHWFQVGNMVPWVEAGVGAVATQALTKASFGPRGLAAMTAGASPARALAKLLSVDPQREQRQVALVDARGRVAQWTGNRCLSAAGHAEGPGFAVQANMMSSNEVWPAMKRAYESTKAPLAERLVAALAAAENAGGDVRGAQSAALLTAPAKATGDVTRDRTIDIRVADHPRPIDELSRLLRLRRAYDASAAGDEALAGGNLTAAQRHFAEARRLAGPTHELAFWQAVSLHGAGHEELAKTLFDAVLAREPRFLKVLPTLPGGGILDEDQVRRILDARKGR